MPVTTATVADWAAVEAHLQQHTGASAYPLTRLNDLQGEGFHHLVLDPQSRTIWWAYDNEPVGGQGWIVEQFSPKEAAEQLDNAIGPVEDRLAELADQPEDSAYAQGFADLDRDQDTMDEYAAVLRLTLGENPADARIQIQAERERIARKDALWQRTYAELVRDLAIEHRGNKSQAGRILGITDVQVGRIIRDDNDRRNKLTDALDSLQD
ncbi:hypothetical protein [Streptomyces sp. CAU 1734]|uniref:hypothetical protein n=1 Tax=Streptomyces sp. CAU 1734 TaxID=3140360 RepID=UPI003261064A